ncbi:GGDEF domain-containing protein [Bosea psychrotolerans]|uniref:Diguanylate cyclase n=1 Tax=Bosea psychrotolerans TaxID=1871628 RepID=A0A2S4MQK5_9HYPH|nr:GGDEF domain-containing protein [Bosea psychrotolerans]POR56971.1 diguanylate cyclase [Bosea psychrotolerans]
MTTAPARAPDNVLPELVDIMFTSLASVVTVGIALAAAAWMSSALYEDQIVAAAGIAAAIVTTGRVLITVAYRRARPRIQSAEQARRWERRYALGGFAFCALLGGVAAYVFLTGEASAQLLIATVLVAYPCGMIIRVAVRPMIARIQLVLTLAPPIVASLVNAEPEHLLMAVMLIAYLVIGFEMISHLHMTILDRIVAHRELARQALHDDLTLLPNRALFRQRLQEECDRSRRYSQSFAVLYLDLDHFKAVNDTLGHAAGDELLRQIALRLKAASRSSDIVARLSGDEFALIQTPLTEQAEACVLAQRLVETIAAPVIIDGREIRVGVSVGVTICRPPGDEPDALLQKADRELYAAKEAGRGRYSISSAAGQPAAV